VGRAAGPGTRAGREASHGLVLCRCARHRKEEDSCRDREAARWRCQPARGLPHFSSKVQGRVPQAHPASSASSDILICSAHASLLCPVSLVSTLKIARQPLRSVGIHRGLRAALALVLSALVLIWPLKERGQGSRCARHEGSELSAVAVRYTAVRQRSISLCCTAMTQHVRCLCRIATRGARSSSPPTASHTLTRSTARLSCPLRLCQGCRRCPTARLHRPRPMRLLVRVLHKAACQNAKPVLVLRALLMPCTRTQVRRITACRAGTPQPLDRRCRAPPPRYHCSPRLLLSASLPLRYPCAVTHLLRLLPHAVSLRREGHLRTTRAPLLLRPATASYLALFLPSALPRSRPVALSSSTQGRGFPTPNPTTSVFYSRNLAAPGPGAGVGCGARSWSCNGSRLLPQSDRWPWFEV
jgi:hypothetical protein